MNNDTLPLPRALTAENGARAALSGEFFEHMEIECHECFERDAPDPDCEICHGAGSYATNVPVTWTTIKAIWRRAVEHFEKQGD